MNKSELPCQSHRMTFVIMRSKKKKEKHFVNPHCISAIIKILQTKPTQTSQVCQSLHLTSSSSLSFPQLSPESSCPPQNNEFFCHCKSSTSCYNFVCFCLSLPSHSPVPWINVTKVINPEIIFHGRKPLTRPAPTRNL